MIKAADMLIARRADTRARADFATWKMLAKPLSRLEPYGMLILIGTLIILPLVGSQFGLNLDIISAIMRTLTGYVVRLLLLVTGNA